MRNRRTCHAAHFRKIIFTLLLYALAPTILISNGPAQPLTSTIQSADWLYLPMTFYNYGSSPLTYHFTSNS
jgi:hypothetical protein